MTNNRLLDLVDSRDFRTLFIDELGWDNPDQSDRAIDIDGQPFTLHQVAGYKGLRIWHCPELPPRKVQRQIDVIVGQDNHERLVIFSNDIKQEWRWPRRAQLGSANAKLLAHEHLVGDRTTHLAQRLQAVELDFDEDISLVALLEKMRGAFDHEAETASVAAARLMGTLYTELETAGVGEHEATLLLARLLFLLFGDDTEMWQPEGQFELYLRQHTTAERLHTDLQTLFDVLDTDEQNRRNLAANSPYLRFRYINGGLFSDPIRLAPLTDRFRDALLAACEFDWSIISPAVFGSMFQTVKSKEARRQGGEHYTTEENILKTIRPLFLDEYRERLTESWDNKGKLSKLHKELGRLQFLDPACGCGNFLIVAYRELRALELDLLKRRRDLDMTEATTKKVERAQLSLDVSGDLNVTLDHFFGIEIEEWPARIAETALLLVDHLANQQMALEFGVAPDRLPIKVAPTIHYGNALEADWADIVAPDEYTYVFGNPPFHGDNRSKKQKADLQRAWGSETQLSRLDYVTAWHATTLKYFGNINANWAFVTTNSIVQGDQTARLFAPIFNSSWRIKFAHRTFGWSTEAKDGAAVHCVIVGFTRNAKTKVRLFDYKTPKSSPEEKPTSTINAYLVDGPSLLVAKRTKPFNSSLPLARKGSEPADGGGLLINRGQYDEVMADPIAAKYVRPFRGAREFLYNESRWCLWLTDLDRDDVRRSSLLRDRIETVRSARQSSDSEEVRKSAATPHLFRIIKQPSVPYICIPRHVSETRLFYIADRYDDNVICGDANSLAPDPTGLLFAVISSSMFITWQRTVGGRLESRLRFGSTLTWNTLPLPSLSKKNSLEIVDAGSRILDARRLFPSRSLAEHYNPELMDPALLKAHVDLDLLVDSAFGLAAKPNSELERQEVLFQLYASAIR
ncbi:MAG: class I SAM-dependent DNA methyltransferase [Rhodococcus sp. (in: high G+C Gram-positive bacteria)]|nr:DNA methyltransferase [Rhodococcus sp. (in: high G+C Gram-positive bacteria)]MDI6627155.1 class I SAM-dependent DNA methyltransferase [Rhodococcus sp. (in: high G+C Gram-positive bacteria)]